MSVLVLSYHFDRREEGEGLEERRGVDTVFFKLRCFPSFSEPWSKDPPTNLARKLDLGFESLSVLLRDVTTGTPEESGPPGKSVLPMTQ